MKTRGFPSAALGLMMLALGAGAFAAADEKPKAAGEKPKAAAKEAKKKDPESRLVRDGVVIDFDVKPVEGDAVMEGKLAEVRFRFTDERTGKPLQGVSTGAWMDVGANIQGQAGADQKDCKEKIGLYLRGAVGIRPLVDLNGYYLLVLNKDPTITVIDPMVSMAGRTSTLQVIPLKRPPMDWANYSAIKHLFISMPAAGKVAVVDTESFKVVGEVDAGSNPTRVVLQPDNRYLWVGNNAKEAKDSGVTVIDAKERKAVKFIATGRGHHEIAVSDDNRTAFVTNRDDGTVTVIDVGTLAKVKDIKTGSVPLSVAFSSLSKAAYVSDGKEGTVTVIDGAKREEVAKMKAKPGLGPLRFTSDGRFGMVVNTAESVVNVIDPGTNEIIHSPKVQAEPFQVIFSRDFAYVRSLGSERVTMINLTSLGKGKEPIVQSFAAGSYPPKQGGDLALADTMVPALGEAAAFVVSPAENSTYFYMEGMNAPMSSYQGRGHLARAVTVIDRSLQEVETGVFVGRLRMPVAGRMDVALSVDQPKMLHCFATQVKANPELEEARKTVMVQFLPQQRKFKVNEKVNVRFKVLDGGGMPKEGLKDVTVRYFRVPASPPRHAFGKEVEKGIYEATVELDEVGAYYVYVSSASAGLTFEDASFLSLLANPAGAAEKAPAPPKKTPEKKG